MPADRWLIADTHFGHEKLCANGDAKREDGTPIRPFANATEMNEAMTDYWNELVKPQDKVDILGDIVISQKFLPVLNKLNGSKRCYRGNHDIFDIKEYLKYFKEVYGVRVFTDYGMVFSHIPLHPDSVDRFGVNVHGHLHTGNVEDSRYFCVSAEHTNYRPMHLDEVFQKIRQKQELIARGLPLPRY